MAKVPSIPVEYQNAVFRSKLYSNNPLYYLADQNSQPISSQDHLDQVYQTLRENAQYTDETTDPGLGAGNMVSGQTYVDERALRTNPETPSLWEKLLNGK
ncbi:MAG: hypothetical protein HYY44_07250 [Deltaproteobacteria bacterium]|nr:hypothetical protein [Deltaproteobacteria bacterium]MBI4374408.1 hypothetical protein [Deltaproteobacteria bacterium]